MSFTRRRALQSLSALAALGVLPMRSESAPPARIGVIGAGWLGGTVGRLWVQAGHEVMFSSRHPEELAPMAKTLGARASVGTPKEAAAFGNILLFAVPYDALATLGKELQRDLRGKIVLDATNPSASLYDTLVRDLQVDSVAEMSAKLLPGTRLVRAFSAVDATAIESSAKRETDKLGVPLASDDVEAIKVVEQLVRDVGCDPVVVGDMAAAQGFQRGNPGFRANTNAPALRRLLGLNR